MRLNVEVKKKLYEELSYFAAEEGYASISEIVRVLLVEYVRRRKREEGIVPLLEEKDGREKAIDG